MPRLINAKPAAAGKRQLHQQSPALVLNGAAGDVVRLHFRDECSDVVTHQIELVPIVLVGRMHGNFRRRESED